MEEVNDDGSERHPLDAMVVLSRLMSRHWFRVYCERPDIRDEIDHKAQMVLTREEWERKQ